MSAHEVLYKYVEELTGQPVDTKQYRPTFTGAMAALDSALTGVSVLRKDIISEALKEHLPTHQGGGVVDNVPIYFEILHDEYDLPSLDRLRIVITNNGQETTVTGNDLTPTPWNGEDKYRFYAPLGSFVEITDTAYPNAVYEIKRFTWFVNDQNEIEYFSEASTGGSLPYIVLPNVSAFTEFCIVVKFSDYDS